MLYPQVIIQPTRDELEKTAYIYGRYLTNFTPNIPLVFIGGFATMLWAGNTHPFLRRLGLAAICMLMYSRVLELMFFVSRLLFAILAVIRIKQMNRYIPGKAIFVVVTIISLAFSPIGSTMSIKDLWQTAIAYLVIVNCYATNPDYYRTTFLGILARTCLTWGIPALQHFRTQVQFDYNLRGIIEREFYSHPASLESRQKCDSVNETQIPKQIINALVKTIMAASNLFLLFFGADNLTELAEFPGTGKTSLRWWKLFSDMLDGGVKDVWLIEYGAMNRLMNRPVLGNKVSMEVPFYIFPG